MSWSGRRRIGVILLLAASAGVVAWLARDRRAAETPVSPGTAESAEMAAERVDPPALAPPEPAHRSARETAPSRVGAATAEPREQLVGVVRDAVSGAPIAGATVTATPALDPPLAQVPNAAELWRQSVSRSGRTDAAGGFAIGVLGAGEHELSAKADGYALARVDGAVAGEPVELRLARAVRLRGRVVAPPGSPAWRTARVQVTAPGPGGWREVTAAGPGGWRARVQEPVAPDGSFALELAPGEHVLTGVSDRHLPSTSRRVVLPRDADAEVVLELRAGCLVRGTVESERGEPIAGARVSLHTPPGASTDTDSAGAFALAVHCGTECHVSASADGFANAEHLLEPRAPDGTGPDVRFVLAAGAALEATVVTSRGEPAAGALVRWHADANVVAPRESGRRRLFLAEQSRATTADAAGHVVLEHLRTDLRGSLLVLGLDGERRFVFVPPLQPGERRDLGTLRTQPSAAVTGTVVTADGAPRPELYVLALCEPAAAWELVPPGARAMQRPANLDLFAATDVAGTFRFGGLGAGAVTIIVQDTAYEPVNVELAGGETRDLGVLRPAAAAREITGAVTFLGARPAGTAKVRYTLGAEELDAGLDAEDRYRIELPASADGELAVAVLVTAPDAYQALDAELAAAGSDVHHVTVPAGEPTEVAVGSDWDGARAKLDVGSDAAFHWRGTFTVQGGAFTAYVQERGPCRVTLSDRTGRVGLREGVLAPGERAELRE